MKFLTTKKFSGLLVGLAVFMLAGTSVTFAANNSNFSQTINTGSLVTDILDGSRNPVTTPGVAMSAKAFSFTCLTGGNASTGTFGTSSERIYVSNADAADSGWTLTMAATGTPTARWANGGASTFFDFNDPTASGCTDGADADTSSGQLTINPSAGSITTDCASCVSTNVTLGSSASFNQGTTDSITLINAAAASNDVWRGYLMGASASQTIPAETPADSYTLNFTLTATAL